MTEQEINIRVRIYSGEHNVQPEDIYVIPKNELVVGETYSGECRNASEAVWNGEKFTYDRYKFGTWFKENINHFEDDDGYDVFVPMKILNTQKNGSQ